MTMWNDPPDNFKELDKLAPDRPDHTCPHIDKAIDSLEKLRQQNEQLREHGKYWREACQELDQERQSLRSQLAQARQVMDRMQDNLHSMADALE